MYLEGISLALTRTQSSQTVTAASNPTQAITAPLSLNCTRFFFASVTLKDHVVVNRLRVSSSLLKTEVPGLQIVISFLPRNRQRPLSLNLCNQVSEVTHTHTALWFGNISPWAIADKLQKARGAPGRAGLRLAQLCRTNWVSDTQEHCMTYHNGMMHFAQFQQYDKHY